MSKSENSAYVRHILPNNFFGNFSNIFLRIQNQREILHFLKPMNLI
jgi:hypothetical protein